MVADAREPVNDGEVNGAQMITGETYRQRIQRAIPDVPFFKSIRFRLTAWYAVAFMIVLVVLSLSLHSLLVRSLNTDTRDRLSDSATAIIAKNEDSFQLINGQLRLNLSEQDRDTMILSGVWFQVFNLDKSPSIEGNPITLSQPPDDLQDEIDRLGAFSEGASYQTITVNGERSMVLVQRLVKRGTQETLGWLVVGEPLGSRDGLIEVVDRALRVIGVAGTGLAICGGWMLAGRALAPVGRITRMADSIAHSEGSVSLTRRLDVPEAGDELTRLSYTINVMLDRIESAFQAQRRFVGDASHELRTPLTAVRGNVDVLLRQIRSGRELNLLDVMDELGVVQRESARMGRLIDDMLVLARNDAPSHGELLKEQVVSLEVLATEAFRTASQVSTGQEMVLNVVEPVLMHGDGDRLVQVMIVLLDNAIRHTPAGAKITLSVDRAIDDETGKPCARVRVADEGAGIPEQHVAHVFDRFYRVEDARTRQSGGTGLGLSIALSIVRGHRGWIDIDTKVDAGTTFTVWLPLAEIEAGNQPADDPAS